ncbi:hypothetical protein A2997_00575 [Candidatus Nomurabacteria bacterium RIFCSPLOWO2_01_FULL_36_10b]|uniref:Elongation factor P C-terminal domain-containing protein n=1 Tax=Candidatus Nomurabacteria bacterium RIFCSPLOWO2_01_FULL_36_10b TaxID=1801766 RepID=A0A1F6WQ52_9BACT|nr:MAG: hypothetical protein A2997_00575 [Candidatus Nomurabacteria bacterium RIFCSPLOWO2_01_FULL_36_10b]
MSLLTYNEIKPKKFILHENAPWEVLDSQVSRKQQNKPYNRTRLRNLNTGQVIDWTFHVNDKVEEADINKKTITYLYFNNKKDEYWFSDPKNQQDRFTLSSVIVGDGIKFIKEKNPVDALTFTNTNGETSIIGISYPIKASLLVTDAPPNIKGDTATGGRKTVTLETGISIQAPLFINTGDIIIINTETGDYAEREEKA